MWKQGAACSLCLLACYCPRQLGLFVCFVGGGGAGEMGGGSCGVWKQGAASSLCVLACHCRRQVGLFVCLGLKGSA
jgi:hypothetical protein